MIIEKTVDRPEPVPITAESYEYLSIIEPIGYSTDDYLSAEQESLLGEIKKHGKVLWSAQQPYKTSFRKRTEKTRETLV